MRWVPSFYRASKMRRWQAERRVKLSAFTTSNSWQPHNEHTERRATIQGLEVLVKRRKYS